MPARSTGKDACDLLDADHRAVKKLFKEYEELAGSRARGVAQKKLVLARRICLELTVHAQIEDELRRLLEQERSEAYQASAIAQVVMPEKSRAIAVVRTPEAPPPPPAQAEAPGILSFPNLASLGEELADLDEF